MKAPVRNRYFLASDVVLLPIAVYTSFVLRLEELSMDRYWSTLLIFGGFVIFITPLIFKAVGIYACYWRYASINELLLLASAVALSSLLAGGLSWIVTSTMGATVPTPRSIPFIFCFLALLVTALPRLIVRLTANYERRQRSGHHRARVLVVGAGNAGAMIVREMRQNAQIGMEIIGFLDDDPAKQNMRIHGAMVLGTLQDISRMIQQHQVQHVIIAMPTAPGKTIRQIVGICERAGVRTKIIPGIYELLDGKVSVSQLRDVQIEDLLRRKPVRTDTTAVADLIRGKRVLVTGGGGSIGSELCRQVLRCEPAQLMILGHGENSVFNTQQELIKQRGNACHIEAVIADIRFPERLQAIFEHYRPEIVFHAAAHKHVPLMELNPTEAITNNVLGTRNLLNVALATEVKHFVMISTDKAVNPTSIMGASKRIAELLVHQAAKASGRAFVAVRFGNVLGSRGSVVLTFKQQIAAGGPVTVTHPEMRRYFMTIPEAVQLVLQAATIGKGGEVFTLDMGEPIKIIDLARDMIKLSGLEVGRDIDIVFTSTRPGEKLYEELFVPGEMYQRTFHEKIFIASNASRFVPHYLNEAIATLEWASQRNDKTLIMHTLQRLIPQMRPVVTDEVRLHEEPATIDPLRARVVGG